MSKKITKDSLLAQIEMEVLNNLDEYAAYRLNNDRDINSVRGINLDPQVILVNEMYDYIFRNHWNSLFGDMVPHLIAKCLGINIGIIEKTLGLCQYRCITSEKQTDDLVFIHLQCSHYNAISCREPIANGYVDF